MTGVACVTAYRQPQYDNTKTFECAVVRPNESTFQALRHAQFASPSVMPTCREPSGCKLRQTTRRHRDLDDSEVYVFITERDRPHSWCSSQPVLIQLSWSLVREERQSSCLPSTGSCRKGIVRHCHRNTQDGTSASKLSCRADLQGWRRRPHPLQQTDGQPDRQDMEKRRERQTVARLGVDNRDCARWRLRRWFRVG